MLVPQRRWGKLIRSIDGDIGLYNHSIYARLKQEEGKVSLMQPIGTELMVRPEGNDRYVRNAPKNPKETRWMYDDDVSLLTVVGYPRSRYRLCKGLRIWTLNDNDNNDHFSSIGSIMYVHITAMQQIIYAITIASLQLCIPSLPGGAGKRTSST